MLYKKGDAEIMEVIKDDEVRLDDEQTRKALNKAAKDAKKGLNKTDVPPESLEN